MRETGNLWETLKGLAITFRHVFKRPTTLMFPEQHPKVFPRFKALHALQRWDDGLERCIGCSLCAANCPADCILVVAGENTPEARYSHGERYAEVYIINELRCIYCGYCQEACPTEAIVLRHEFRLANHNRKDFIWDKRRLLDPLPGQAQPSQVGERK